MERRLRPAVVGVVMRAESERTVLLAAIALDRAKCRRRETAWHVALVLLLLAVALPIVGAGLAKLLLALRLV